MMRLLIATMALFVAVPVLADGTMPPAPYAYRQLDDPAQEAKAQALMETLRCLKCQSQSIADSDAPMAGDMRSLVRERIAAGEEPEAIALGMAGEVDEEVELAVGEALRGGAVVERVEIVPGVAAGAQRATELVIGRWGQREAVDGDAGTVVTGEERT